MNKQQQLVHAKRLRKAVTIRSTATLRLIKGELEGESLIEAAKEFWAADDAVEKLRKGKRP